MGETLNFPRDIDRFKYFVRASKEHPAKLEMRTFRWLVEKYTSIGDILLDPMSGIGTVHLAATMGRNTIAIELEEDYIKIQRDNIEKLSSTLGFTGWTQLLPMDCRRAMPFPPGFINCIIFSPPYGSVQSGAKTARMELRPVQTGYGEDIANIGNISVYPLYLEAMKQVYKLCNRSLLMGRIMISVTKDYVERRERKLVTKDNIRLCVESGFELIDWHLRYTDPRIFQITSRKKRQDEGTDRQELHIDFEDLLIFRKRSEV